MPADENKKDIPPDSGRTGPCLVSRGGARYDVREPVTRIGRAAGNDVVISGADATVVSGRHAEIRREGGSWRIFDLESTNGTYVDGVLVSEAELVVGCVVQLGSGGPELWFRSDAKGTVLADDLSQTVVAPADAADTASSELATEHERALHQAIVRARLARRAGVLNQTGAIMREVMATVVHRSNTKLKRAMAVMAGVLVVVVGLGVWKIETLRRDKRSIDARIRQLEHSLAAAGQDPARADQLIQELDRYQSEGRALENSVLFRWGARGQQDFLATQIRSLMAEFGAEIYSVPPEFLSAVKDDLDMYQGPRRPDMARALGEAKPEIERMSRILEQNKLPRDFAYMTLVESAMNAAQTSSAQGAGLWQLTPATARSLGLRVDQKVDERLNTTKATEAACKYIRNLILDFGSGSSVMLALAAYNLGPTRVKQAIRRVSDPIKQRDFWYLYRIHALPAETRDYVPRVIAAMIIGRHPKRYGF